MAETTSTIWLTRTGLRARGWSKIMRRVLLPEPEETIGPPQRRMAVWSLATVQGIEGCDEVQTWIRDTLSCSLITSAASCRPASAGCCPRWARRWSTAWPTKWRWWPPVATAWWPCRHWLPGICRCLTRGRGANALRRGPRVVGRTVRPPLPGSPRWGLKSLGNDHG